MSTVFDVASVICSCVSSGVAFSYAYRLKRRLRSGVCQCSHAASFHDDKGCHIGRTTHYVDVYGNRSSVDGCGCKRYVRLGTSYDPNLEGDIAKLELINKIQREYIESHTPPTIQKRGWPLA